MKQFLKKDEIVIKTIEDSDIDHKNSFSEFSGMWKDKDIDLNIIRERSWKK